jgi:tetratricopeptide (TPR) repeat protein
MVSEVGETNTERTGAASQAALEYFESGWSHYASKDFDRSQANFLKALEIQPDYVDALYGLGMVYQASGRQQEAIAAFEKVIALLQNSPEVESVRARMLTRFARGHINRITTGDWQMGQT